MSHSEFSQSSPAAIESLGRRLTTQDLPGRWSKFLVVPSGYQGVQVCSGEVARRFPAGRHRVLTLWQRLRGQGSQCVFGILTAQPFLASVRLSHLLSADEQLLELQAFLSLRIRDPERFFREVILRHGDQRGEVLDLSATPLAEALARLTTQYLAEDLCSDALSQRLSQAMPQAVEFALALLGLEISGAGLFSFWRADQQVTVARKALELEEQWKQLDLERKMMELENQSTLQDFTRQLQESLGVGIALTAAPSAAAPAQPAPRPTLQSLIRNWLNALQQSQPSKLPWRLLKALRDEEQPPAPLPSVELRQARQWFIRRLLWVILILGVALALSVLVAWFSRQASPERRFEFYVVIWAPTLGLLIESLIAMMRKREELAAALWSAEGVTELDELAGKDRRKIDQLVRRQCAGDLQQALQALQEGRSTLYRAGQTELALQVKALERKLEEAGAEVTNAAQSTAAYVSDPPPPPQAWQRILDEEEQLLLRAAQLAERAFRLQQLSLQAAEALPTHLKEFEAQVNAFLHEFRARQRPLRLSASVTQAGGSQNI